MILQHPIGCSQQHLKHPWARTQRTHEIELVADAGDDSIFTANAQESTDGVVQSRYDRMLNAPLQNEWGTPPRRTSNHRAQHTPHPLRVPGVHHAEQRSVTTDAEAHHQQLNDSAVRCPDGTRPTNRKAASPPFFPAATAKRRAAPRSKRARTR